MKQPSSTISSPRARSGSLLRRYLQAILLWSPLLCLAITLLEGARPFLPAFATSLAISFIVGTSCFVVVAATRWAEAVWARRRGRPAPQHGTAWYFALSLLVMPLGLFLAFAIVGAVLGIELPFRIERYRFGMLLGGGIAGAFLLWETRADARDAARVAELRVQELEQRALRSQLAALSAQMNPHLLFNALNTVAALVHSDPARAEDTILRLADLYRGVLAASGRATHSLDEELRICEAYLEVERARFGDRLRGRVELPAALRTAVEVPVLVLQPLVENAIKHGLQPRAAGGQVSILGRVEGGRLELLVEDDGVGLGRSTHAGSGTAVDNTRRRLQLSYGDEATLELVARPEGGTRAVLRLPMPAEAAA